MNRKILLLVILFLSLQTIAKADKELSITSDPPGARVEFNGKFIGNTPIVEKLDDFFFKGPKWIFSKYLSSPIDLIVSKPGYVTKTVSITIGPFVWPDPALGIPPSKIYYLISSTSFHIKLDSIEGFLGTNPLANGQSATTVPTAKTSASVSDGKTRTNLSHEEIVQAVLPAIVTINTESGSGSGFFITESGVVVTNKHVVRNAQTVSIVTARGEHYKSISIFIHPKNDLALIKVNGYNFPFLRIANPAKVNVGAEVLAIGSPGLPGEKEILHNSVTKGIISAFRNSNEFSSLRKLDEYGVLIQTDASINHGNSGGPLLNLRAEVVGVNTLGFREGGAVGINFAIFSSEILRMLKEYFNYNYTFDLPDEEVSESTSRETKVATSSDAKVSVTISSEPEGAEIYVNGVYNSSTNSTLLLPTGEHVIRISRPGFKIWERKVTIESGSSKTFHAILERESKK